MTEENSDRPTPRPRGGGTSEPRPAPEEHRDPILPASPQAPAAAPARRRRGPEAFSQLNTRVDPLLNDLIAAVSDSRGWSKREVVENALKKAYAAEFKTLSS